MLNDTLLKSIKKFLELAIHFMPQLGGCAGSGCMKLYHSLTINSKFGFTSLTLKK